MTLVDPSGIRPLYEMHKNCNITYTYIFGNSHYYIVISPIQLEDPVAVKESELIPANQEKRDANFPLYVTASINYDDFHPTFTIGDGSSSIDPISQKTFYNVPLQKHQTYYYFIRAYSVAHTTEVSQRIYVCTYVLVTI